MHRFMLSEQSVKIGLDEFGSFRSQNLRKGFADGLLRCELANRRVARVGVNTQLGGDVITSKHHRNFVGERLQFLKRDVRGDSEHR